MKIRQPTEKIVETYRNMIRKYLFTDLDVEWTEDKIKKQMVMLLEGTIIPEWSTLCGVGFLLEWQAPNKQEVLGLYRQAESNGEAL